MQKTSLTRFPFLPSQSCDLEDNVLALRACLRAQAKRVVVINALPDVAVALARAVQFNANGRGGVVFCTTPSRVHAQHTRRLAAARCVQPWLVIRTGDARVVLQDLDGPVHMLWLAAPPAMGADVLAILESRLSADALVVQRHAPLQAIDALPL